MESADFYVYAYFRPWNGEPCYIGKGKEDRWLWHSSLGAKHPNKHFARVFAKANGQLPSLIIRRGLKENEAFNLERLLIQIIGRYPLGPLVNLSDGGDGNSGWCPSEETRHRIKTANTGKKASEETRKKMSLARKGRPKTKEHRAAIGKANKGRKVSGVTLDRIKRTRQLRNWAEDQRQRAILQHANMTEEQKRERSRKISEAVKMANARARMKQESFDLSSGPLKGN